MKSLRLLLAVHCCLALLHAAPLPERDALTRAAELGLSFAKKILDDIPRVHDACVKTKGLTLELSAEAHNLEYLLSEIGIPAAPVLKKISEDHSLAESLSRILEGLDLHQDLLQKLSDVLSSTETLELLLADMRDLSTQVQQIQQLAQIPVTVSQRNIPDISSRLSSDYIVQVAAHLSLQQLRRFTQDVFRCLRHIAVS
ncbi:hypothetical protein E1301_Tti019519 [Triplophysa tibetana]|uniref:Granulocyte colony-stimulating factor n=1 Tax=Triplophysa tibetana TaxID=1572043 RepID=A0A5A9NL61_9TELE|nr:hypothetical protein E1301_Tti019519 [Triplophysa tibetana]